MSWQCTSWALREAPAPTSTARLVLIALADRCQPDGRSAWPTVDTLAAEAHTSPSSVKRALKALEECGAIRRGNQSLAQWDEHGQWVPEPYRPVVWECCMNVTLEHIVEKPGRQARAEREQRLGTDDPDVRENSGVKMTPLENVENTPISSGVKMTPLTVSQEGRGSTSDTSRGSTSDTPIKETNKETNNPSAPTGHLPASGETPPEDENTKPVEAHVPDHGDAVPDVLLPNGDGSTFLDARLWIDPNAGPEPGDDLDADIRGAGFVLDALEAGWAKTPSMPVPRAVAGRHKRETAAARRLIGRHGLETVVKVALWATSPAAPDAASVSGGKPYDGFWRRTVTGVRSLESSWDRIVAQMADDRDGRATLVRLGISTLTPADTAGRPGPTAPSYGIPDDIDRRVNRLLPADLWQLHDCDQQATRLKLRALLKTNPDMDGHELAAQAVEYGRTRYRAALDAERRVRADREARSRAAKAALDEYRRSHGGSCFIGSGKPSGSVVVTGPGGRSM